VSKAEVSAHDMQNLEPMQACDLHVSLTSVMKGKYLPKHIHAIME